MSTGLLLLRFALDRHGRTRLTSRRQRYPLVTTAVLPMESEMGALIYLQNAAGSVFGGDHLDIELRLGPCAELCVSTPSATRLQGDELSVQTVRIELGAGAFFESVPETIIPHPKAKHRQQTCVELGPGATAIFVESLAPGRVARGERHLYGNIAIRLEASFDGNVVLNDAFSFRPAEADPGFEGVLGSFGYVGSLLALSENGDHEALAGEINARLASFPNVYGGAAALASGFGVLARFLVDDAPILSAVKHSVWDAARLHLHGNHAPHLRR